jgi:DNA-binding NarL/FixJ family response regulator
MRILLIVEDLRTRLALQFLLSYQPNLTLVGAVDRRSDPKPLIEATHPDVVLIDWDYASPTGPDMVSAAQAATHPTKIVIVSSNLDAEQAALAAGADAFVSKGDPPELLLARLHALKSPQQSSLDPPMAV